MATRYSMEKYARIRGMKNETLSQLTADLKRRKLYNEKGDAAISLSVQIIPSFSILSFEVIASTPSTTHLKGKGKVGKST
nr:hypothetical protein CFP56_37634 [Quercus suber]